MALFVKCVCLLSALSLGFVSSSDGLPPDLRPPSQGLDPCTTECYKKIAILTDSVLSCFGAKDGNSKDGSQTDLCQMQGADSCSRGCRFFRISQLLDEQLPDQNSSVDACKTLCKESYSDGSFDLMGCVTGCDVSSTMYQGPVIAELSFSFFIEGGNSFQLLQDLSEPDEILTDPGLREQVSKIEKVRIPEIRMKTLPVASEKESTENVNGWWSVGSGGCGWIRGVPHCLAGSLLLLLVLFVLWYGFFFPDEKPEEQAKELPEKIPLPTV